MPASTMPDTDTARLDMLRKHMQRIDPDCELIVEPASGERLVRGDSDAHQLEAALRLPGLGGGCANEDGSGNGNGGCGGCDCG